MITIVIPEQPLRGTMSDLAALSQTNQQLEYSLRGMTTYCLIQTHAKVVEELVRRQIAIVHVTMEQ